MSLSDGHDTRRAVLRAAHRHYRRMVDRHPDWPFSASLRIELHRARSVSALMARVAAQIANLSEQSDDNTLRS